MQILGCFQIPSGSYSIHKLHVHRNEVQKVFFQEIQTSSNEYTEDFKIRFPYFIFLVHVLFPLYLLYGQVQQLLRIVCRCLPQR
jgi:hypothetical protein